MYLTFLFKDVYYNNNFADPLNYIVLAFTTMESSFYHYISSQLIAAPLCMYFGSCYFI